MAAPRRSTNCGYGSTFGDTRGKIGRLPHGALNRTNYARLVELGKTDIAYASALAR